MFITDFADKYNVILTISIPRMESAYMMNIKDQSNDILRAVYRLCAWLVCVLLETSNDGKVE